MTPTELEEKRKDAENFVKSYIPRTIDASKFDESKARKNEFVFTKNEILEETGWKNGTFYNRLGKTISMNEGASTKDILHRAMELGYYIKKKAAGDKTEKLLFSYFGLCALLQTYFLIDLKGAQETNCQDNVKQDFKNTSTSRQNDDTSNNTDAIFYEKLLAEKEKMIQSLQVQVEELTNIVKLKEAKELELAKIDYAKTQKQLYVNDAEGNRKQSFFARIFGRRRQEESPND